MSWDVRPRNAVHDVLWYAVRVPEGEGVDKRTQRQTCSAGGVCSGNACCGVMLLLLYSNPADYVRSQSSERERSGGESILEICTGITTLQMMHHAE
jgi:hypothetical protein